MSGADLSPKRQRGSLDQVCEIEKSSPKRQRGSLNQVCEIEKLSPKRERGSLNQVCEIEPATPATKFMIDYLAGASGSNGPSGSMSAGELFLTA
jgi:hypothetical protein